MVTKNRNKNYKKYIDERLYGLCCCYAPPTPTKPPPSKRNKKLNFFTDRRDADIQNGHRFCFSINNNKEKSLKTKLV